MFIVNVGFSYKRFKADQLICGRPLGSEATLVRRKEVICFQIPAESASYKTFHNFAETTDSSAQRLRSKKRTK